MASRKGYISNDLIDELIRLEWEPDDDLMQEFYALYGLEPDEQPLEIQYKSMLPIETKHNWKWFYNQYKKNGLFEVYEEELDEFDVDGLTY